MMMARQFRRPDWRRMLSEISAVDYIDWYRHFGRYPVDYQINQFAMGQICATILLPHVQPDNLPSISDFYYNRPESPEQTADDMQALAGSIPGMESFT